MKVLKNYFKITGIVVLSLIYFIIFSVSCGAGEEPTNGGTTPTPTTPEQDACQQAVEGYMEAALAIDVDAAFENISPGAYTRQELTDFFSNAREFLDGYEKVEATNFSLDESKDPREALYLGTARYEGGYKGWISADMVEGDGTWLIKSFVIDVEQSKKDSYQN